VLNRRGIPETRFVGDELRPKLPVIIRTASRITGDTVGIGCAELDLNRSNAVLDPTTRPIDRSVAGDPG